MMHFKALLINASSETYLQISAAYLHDREYPAASNNPANDKLCEQIIGKV